MHACVVGLGIIQILFGIILCLFSQQQSTALANSGRKTRAKQCTESSYRIELQLNNVMPEVLNLNLSFLKLNQTFCK